MKDRNKTTKWSKKLALRPSRNPAGSGTLAFCSASREPQYASPSLAVHRHCAKSKNKYHFGKFLKMKMSYIILGSAR